ncbi:uncharacterized protein LOC130793145 [Actinidia eriantha]|uniref:uncharacterized protein LOC130793145 n=1 Tax=Actinidia eriantha TaxID=165200 RepID=UPI002587B8A3|nr:uncharacterized protein LOC130793145 [Actinidia eriantha]
MKTRVSSRFKLPTQLGIYEGKTYQIDHLDSYKNLMSLQGYINKVMCKAFLATLKGLARTWFKKLSPETIDSFGELSRLFVANFMSCRVRQKSVSYLFTVPQKDGESIKEYVKHFNQAVLEAEDASDKVVVMAMMEGLPHAHCLTLFPRTSLQPCQRSKVRLTSTLQQKNQLRPNEGGEERMTIKGRIHLAKDL